MKQVTFSIKLVIENRKAIRAMRATAQALHELGDDLAWRPEIKRAAKALDYACKHLRTSRPKRKP